MPSRISLITLVKARTRSLKIAKPKDAVVRNLEIVGEAVKNLSPQFKANYPEIHWKAISGMRDKLIHDVPVFYTTPQNCGVFSLK